MGTVDPEFLMNGPERAALTLILAHGAGAPMDSPFMAAFAEGLAGPDLRVARFEFPYMAKRRTDGRRRPPDRLPILIETWQAAIEALGGAKNVAIGGKSLGGRIASLIADESGVRGLVCLGYPFHPSGKPAKTRTEHLAMIETPTLILQGTRDPLGSEADVAGYTLSSAIQIRWLEDGDHSYKPRKASGRTERENWSEGVKAAGKFLAGL